MLVLSRRLNEKIVFPGIHASIKIVGVRQGVVSLGIDAPREVTVLREEVPDRLAEWGVPTPPVVDRSAETRLRKKNQALRNRLRSGCADLKVLRRQLRMGFYEDAEATLDKIEEDFEVACQ